MKTSIDNQKVFDSVTRIHNLFGLAEQGKGLVSLIARILKCPGVCLIFLNEFGDKLSVLSCKPSSKSSLYSGMSIDIGLSVIEQILREERILKKDDPVTAQLLESVIPDSFDSKLKSNVELVVPLTSSGRMIGMLLIEKREAEEYTEEEMSLVYDVALRLAPGLEKEYLRDQLTKREKELTVLNSCCRVFSSALDVPDVYEKFIDELKELIDVDWSSIMLLENENMTVLAIHSDIGTTWRPGESMPVKGTSTEWVTTLKMPLVESDLKIDSLFVTDVYHRKQGLRSVVCVPVMVTRDEVIGSLIIGSRKPDAYNPKQVGFITTLASQIAMPVQNACLYAEVLKRSRYDELTGLLNRRTLDEQIIIEIDRHSRYGGFFSLILLDLDSMKYINDHYGHLAGDGLLARNGIVLKEAIRSVDQAFRYGGDEFAILLPNTPADSAVKVSERVRKRIAAKLVVDDMIVTASFGLASWPENGPEAVDVVAAADAALYRVKHQGGNRSFTSDQS